MNLNKKRRLAARTFNVGLSRIVLMQGRADEIKEAITKQDMRDLQSSGAIIIKDEKGRRKIKERTERGPGKIKKTINKRKQKYVKLTRKLREFAKQLKLQGRLNSSQYKEVRKQIKSSAFRSKSHFKEIVKPNEKIKMKEKKK